MTNQKIRSSSSTWNQRHVKFSSYMKALFTFFCDTKVMYENLWVSIYF